MDFEHTPANDGPSSPPPAPSEAPGRPGSPIGPASGTAGGKPRAPRRSPWRIILTLLLMLSVLANVLLFAGLLLMAGLAATTGGTLLAGSSDQVVEQVLEPGPASTKIAVIRLNGMIDMNASQTAAHIDQIDRFLAFATATGQISKRKAAEYRAERRRAVAHLMAITAPTAEEEAMSDDELIAELMGV